jgi:site-specific recombinase XerD
MNRNAAIQRLREVCRRQHKSLSTERTYALWLADFIGFIQQPKAVALSSSEKKLEGFLTMLALKRNVSASTQNQAFNAVVFFYKDVLGQPLQHATHCLERGTNIKALAEAMGHAQITTTEGYCHAEALSVVSPLE